MFVNMFEYRTKKAYKENKEKAYMGALPPPERAFKSLVVNSLKGANWKGKIGRGEGV